MSGIFYDKDCDDKGHHNNSDKRGFIMNVLWHAQLLIMVYSQQE